jgi:hypothetical protein
MSGARRWLILVLANIALGAVSRAQAQIAPTADRAAGAQVDEVVVTASRRDLVGRATTASQGALTITELRLRPTFRVGQLLEATPGLVVTTHSGEGKANQYLIRGFNLDHGTDVAVFVDDMPVNRPTNAHGQGYADLNFIIPATAAGVDYAKGPFFAAAGDFGSVAQVRLRLTDAPPDQLSVTAGSLRDGAVTISGTRTLSAKDRLAGALDLARIDGPWSPPERFRKTDAMLKFSHGAPDTDGYTLTALYYRSSGGLTTDQPLRAIHQGLIGRYGSLDPSDASRSERASLSARLTAPGAGGRLTLSAYAVASSMTLWNDFTHFLDDPVNGDQEQQDERRRTFGGEATYQADGRWGRAETSTIVGLQARYDDVALDRRHTLARVTLGYCEAEQASGPAVPYPAVGGACASDQVRLADIGAWLETTTRWTGFLRTVLGAREEDYRAFDHSRIAGLRGSKSQTLPQPKASLVLGPWAHSEIYLSVGRGFHSNDVRGVFGTVPVEGVPALAGQTPLLAPTTGEEIGLRTSILPKTQVQLALFRQDFRSELRYDPDVGQDAASAPSRRQGVEFSFQYRPTHWLELNTDLAVSRARYVSANLAAYGLAGPYIANAPAFIGSLGVLVSNLGPWSGGLQWRILGPYPIADGQRLPRDPGYSEVNAEVERALGQRLTLRVEAFNLLGSHQNAAAYDYATRLPGEPAGGLAGYQVHPLEPRSARLTLTQAF